VQDVIQWVQANVSLVAVLAVLLAFAIPRVRDWLLSRVVGYAWLKITASARAAEALAKREGARQERLRDAVESLSEGLSDSLTSITAHQQIQKAITTLRIERPPELGPDLDKIPGAIQGEEGLRPPQIRALVDPIIAKVRAERRDD
jgi:hypothetical protein